MIPYISMFSTDDPITFSKDFPIYSWLFPCQPNAASIMKSLASLYVSAMLGSSGGQLERRNWVELTLDVL